MTNELEHILDEDSEYDCGEQWRLIDGPITYDRQDIHLYLDPGNVNDAFLAPLFFLDGGSRSFEHEKEYRFVAYNVPEIYETTNDRLQDPIPLRGNYVPDVGIIERTVNYGSDHITVEIDPRKLISGVILGPNIRPKDVAAIEKELARVGATVALTRSSL